MKRSAFLLFFVALFTIGAKAQTKAVQTATISTPNVLCEDCKTRLTTYLDRYDGIQGLKFNLRKGEITVKYLTDRINIEEIKTAIANAGYDADDVPAEPGAYQRLPKTCKKPEDGGGHPVRKVAAPAPAPAG